jgi:hypothetical protein
MAAGAVVVSVMLAVDSGFEREKVGNFMVDKERKNGRMAGSEGFAFDSTGPLSVVADVNFWKAKSVGACG